MSFLGTFFGWRGAHHGKRNARTARRSLREQRRQTALLAGMAAAPPAPTPQRGRTLARVERWWRTRRTWTQRLVQTPDVELRWWVMWVGVTVFSAIGHAGSLLITIPVGAYLFACRRAAARARVAVDHDPPTAPMVTVPDPVQSYRLPATSGRHAR